MRMKSPFPGMDPYLESHWRDVHGSLVTNIRDTLQPRLPEDVVARIGARAYVDTPEEAQEQRRYYDDVRVLVDDWDIPSEPFAASSSLEAPVEPIVFWLDHEPITEGFIQIRDLKD